MLYNALYIYGIFQKENINEEIYKIIITLTLENEDTPIVKEFSSLDMIGDPYATTAYYFPQDYLFNISGISSGKKIIKCKYEL
jgi:hypothetical protein